MKSKKITRDDEERRLWVLNDEGLYLMWKNADPHEKNIQAFIKKNRIKIDEVINNILSGRHQAHYLQYNK